MMQWGTKTVAANSSAAVSYSPDFASFAIPIVSATVRNFDSGQNENTGYADGTASKTGFTIYNSENFSNSVHWLAVGVCSMATDTPLPSTKGSPPTHAEATANLENTKEKEDTKE